MAKKNTAEITQDSLPSGRIERVFTSTRKVFCDTFKLLAAPCIKRVGLAMHPNENPQDFMQAEHTHFYFTKDAKGNEQKKCVPIAGHFHEVTLQYNEADPLAAPQVVAVSGPLKLVRRKVHGRTQLVSEPVNDYDHHSHDVQYVKTAEIQVGAVNLEAQKVIAYEAQKGAPIAGVIG